MAYSIEIEILGGLTARQQTAFERAAEKWATVITGDLPSGTVPSAKPRYLFGKRRRGVIMAGCEPQW